MVAGISSSALTTIFRWYRCRTTWQYTITGDAVSSIVATYLSPALLCDVAYVRAASGRTHPIIRVPPHGVIPICATRNGPHGAKDRPQGIVSPLVYIRAVGPNGPESVPISRPDDWEKLIRRCVLADRTALLGLIESVLTPRQVPGSREEDPLKRWHDAARHRYLELIEQQAPEWNTSLASNHYQLSYTISATAPVAGAKGLGHRFTTGTSTGSEPSGPLRGCRASATGGGGAARARSGANRTRPKAVATGLNVSDSQPAASWDLGASG
jgi:hypothetical protein